MLHIIDDFPVEPSALNDVESGDTVLFIENAVLAVKQGARGFTLLKQALTHLNFCVLASHLRARGVAANEVERGVSVIDEQDFEDLTEDNVAVKSWN